jgi:hypothetical protein
VIYKKNITEGNTQTRSIREQLNNSFRVVVNEWTNKTVANQQESSQHSPKLYIETASSNIATPIKAHFAGRFVKGSTNWLNFHSALVCSPFYFDVEIFIVRRLGDGNRVVK